MTSPSKIATAASEHKDKWLSLMKVHDCAGESFEVAKRILESVEKDIVFHEAFSESEQTSMLVDMIFDAGFCAGRAAKKPRL